MALPHLLRVGAMGHVGRFDSTDATRYPRGTEVVVRTGRGLELGRVLAPSSATDDGPRAEGHILRPVTIEDQLLAARLEKGRHRAFAACAARLAELNVPATLVDVEHLFDGESLFFYFLGDVTPEVERLSAELAELYEATVKFRQFTDALVNGCGPGCGTPEAEGAGCGSSCSSCAVAGACGTKRK